MTRVDWDNLPAAAQRHGFEVQEHLDLSARAIPTMDYFARAIPAYRERLVEDLGITNEQVDELTDGLRAALDDLEA